MTTYESSGGLYKHKSGAYLLRIISDYAYIGGDDDKLSRVRKTTGEVTWEFTGVSDRVVHPKKKNGIVYFPSNDTYYYAINPDDGSVSWSYQARNGCSANHVSDRQNDEVYFVDDGEWLYSVNSPAGTLNWETQFSSVGHSRSITDQLDVLYMNGSSIKSVNKSDGTVNWTNSDGGDFTAHPTVYAGNVYCGNQDNNFYSIDASTGSTNWTFSGEAHPTGDPEYIEYYGELPVVDGYILFGTQSQNFYSIDAESGSQNWKFDASSEISSTPEVDEYNVYFGDDSGAVYALDLETGTKQWEFNSTSGAVRSVFDIDDGVLYFSDSAGFTYALETQGPSLSWGKALGGGVDKIALDRSYEVLEHRKFEDNNYVVRTEAVEKTPVIDWEYSLWNDVTAIGAIQPPLYDGENLYFGGFSGNFYSINESDGTREWYTSVSDSGDQQYEFQYGQGEIVNGVIYSPTYSWVYAFDQNDGTLLWENNVGFSIEGGLVYYDGMVYVGNDDLHALDPSTGVTQWVMNGYASYAGNILKHNGYLYTGSNSGDIYEIDPDTQTVNRSYTGTTGSGAIQGLTYSDGYIYFTASAYQTETIASRIDLSDMTSDWEYNSGNSNSNNMSTEPTVYGGNVYITGWSGIYALDKDTGSMVWSTSSDHHWNAPVIANNILYISTDTGVLKAFNPQNGNVIWSKDINESVFGPMIPGENKFFLTDYDDRLVKYIPP